MYYCDIVDWGKSFTNKHSLKRHRITHDPNKKYKCDTWSKSFSLPQYLKEHKVVHTGERPFTCKFAGCGKSFRQAGKLSIHRKDHLSPKKNKNSKVKRATTFTTAQNDTADMSETYIFQNLSETCDLANLVNQYCLWGISDFPQFYPLVEKNYSIDEYSLSTASLPISSSLELADPLPNLC